MFPAVTNIREPSHINNHCAPPGDVPGDLVSRLHGPSLHPRRLFEEVCGGGMVDHQVVAPVGVHGGAGGQRHALAEYRGPEVEILHELLNVDPELAQLGGHGRARHGHLGGDRGPQAADVMLDLGRGGLLQPRRLGGHAAGWAGPGLGPPPELHWATRARDSVASLVSGLVRTAAATLYIKIHNPDITQ